MKTTSTLPSIPEALVAYIKEHGLKHYQMAALLGVPKTHFSEVIHGKRLLARGAMAKAYKLGIPADILLQEPK